MLIRFDPGLTTAAPRISCGFSSARDQGRRPRDLGPPRPKPVGFGLANTSLVLAVAGEIFAPALLPACALLLVGSNLDTFRAAGRQLFRGRLGLPALYTSIVVATRGQRTIHRGRRR